MSRGQVSTKQIFLCPNCSTWVEFDTSVLQGHFAPVTHRTNCTFLVGLSPFGLWVAGSTTETAKTGELLGYKVLPNPKVYRN